MRTIVITGLLVLASATGCRSAATPAAAPPPTIEPAAVAADPASVVQRQVDAYNRRDLDDFLSVFSPDAQLLLFPNELLFAGHNTLRSVYGKLISEAVDLHAEVTNRIVQGNYVIDREITTGMPGKPTQIGLAIYEVKNGLVTRVWFVD